jgi:NhaP-type Na+/H+ or K+/H+ antiporter
MGVALANQHRIDLRLMQEFHETLVQLLIGVLFVLIAASVTPAEVRAVLPEALLLVAAMVLVIRPVAVALATLRSGLPWRERAFAAWMAPRGIVAGATASAFGLQLQEAGVEGAAKLLPIAFVAIFGTVVLYGLTAGPVARLLGVAGEGRTLVLVVGDTPEAAVVAQEMASAGVEVMLWEGRPMVEAVSHEAELEEVTDAVLMSSSADFNALAAAALRIELGHDHVVVRAPAG